MVGARVTCLGSVIGVDVISKWSPSQDAAKPQVVGSGIFPVFTVK